MSNGKRAAEMAAGKTAGAGIGKRALRQGPGAVLGGAAAVAVVWAMGWLGPGKEPGAGAGPRGAEVGGGRSVAQLAALSDEELDRVDLVEMNVAVAREIPGLGKLEYDGYRRTVDGWTERFRKWLVTVEPQFLGVAERYQRNLNFFRLGMLAQFLDEQVGIAYVEDQKQADLEARKTGRRVEVAYTNPGDLLLHGLIDSKRGTCGTMPTLHAAIGRRMGWPVSLACAGSHVVCRYEAEGKVFNIEATDTGRGGFAAGTDVQYMAKEGVSAKAVECGSDLRRLTGRQMLGLFVAARGRHYADTGKTALAARDYALAHSLAPTLRKVYTGLMVNLAEAGDGLFEANEQGHPGTLAGHLTARYGRKAGPGTAQEALEELRRVEAVNAASRRQVVSPLPAGGVSASPGVLPPVPPGPARPPVPGAMPSQGRMSH